MRKALMAEVVLALPFAGCGEEEVGAEDVPGLSKTEATALSRCQTAKMIEARGRKATTNWVSAAAFKHYGEGAPMRVIANAFIREQGISCTPSEFEEFKYRGVAEE